VPCPKNVGEHVVKFRDLKFGEHFIYKQRTGYLDETTEIEVVKTEPDEFGNAIHEYRLLTIGDDEEVTKLNSYRVAGEYTCVFEIEVYAETLEDAIETIENDDSEYVKIQGDYLDDSFSVNHEFTESLNKPELEPDFE
jgi:hypothetical protein